MLKLKADPTFWAKVEVPIAGQDKPVVIECEFAHMTRDEWAEFSKPQERSDEDVLMRILRGWRNVDAPFERAAVVSLIQQHHAFGRSVASKYGRELNKAREGN